MAAAQCGDREAARAQAGVIAAALGAVAAYCDWAPLGRLAASSVVEACSFFLGTVEFRRARRRVRAGHRVYLRV
jgi:hypothetical protein